MPSYRVLTGPTAAGKTDWLLRRSERVPIRVISADSRQVYRHMDIGTGKPTAHELERLPHYGIDLIYPVETYSAHDFVMMAAESLKQLEEFSGEVWICGGTGLYIRALIEALPLGPPPRPKLRAALQELIAKVGPETVAKELGLSDRENRNPVRVLRQAESAAGFADGSRVYVYAGLPASLALSDVGKEDSVEAHQDALGYLSGWKCEGTYVLDPGHELEQRIKSRVNKMFETGLVEEVRELRRLGFGNMSVVKQGIGYQQAGALLDNFYENGRQAAYWSIVATRQYAKRQRTYFRGMGWLVHNETELDTAVGEAMT